MSNGNWLKLNRSLLDWGWYGDTNTFRVFIHLLLKAQWKDCKWGGENLKAGDVIFGRKRFAEELGMSEQNVRTAIQHLQKTGEISTIKATNRYTVLRVEKWSIYQDDELETNQQANHQPTNSQPTTNHYTKRKEGKNIYNNYIYCRESGEKKPLTEVVSEIISYLNEKCGTRYKPTTKETVSLIKARLKDFNVEDFYRVIDNMVYQWGNDPKMKDYLRPQTLFGTKFESYLNRTPTTGNAFADAVMRGDFK